MSLICSVLLLICIHFGMDGTKRTRVFVNQHTEYFRSIIWEFLNDFSFQKLIMISEWILIEPFQTLKWCKDLVENLLSAMQFIGNNTESTMACIMKWTQNYQIFNREFRIPCAFFSMCQFLRNCDRQRL